MTGDSRFPVSMSGLSNSPKRDASTRSIPVPGGEIAKSIASGNTRRTQKRGERSYQLKCDIRDAGVGGLTKKCAKQSKQRARPELLWLLETEDNGGMGFPAAKRHNCGAGSRAQLAESRAATQDHHYRGLIDGGVGFVEGSLGQVHGRRGQSQCQQNQFPNQDCPTKTPHFRSQRPLDCTLPGWFAAVNGLTHNWGVFSGEFWCSQIKAGQLTIAVHVAYSAANPPQEVTS